MILFCLTIDKLLNYNLIMKIIIENKIFNLEIADTFKKRFIGLMRKKNIKTGLFFPKTRSIHTFFMKDNIDIIMIHTENEIIYFKKNVPRNRIIIKKEAYHTIELPKNSINQLKIGNKLTIKS